MDTEEFTKFYGLVEMPFNISPDPSFLFRTAQHTGAIEKCLYIVNDHRGLVAVYGNVGMGKTTIARLLYQRLQDTPKTEVAMLITPALNTKQALLRAIMSEFDVPQKRSYDLSLMAFQDFIIEKASGGINLVAIIDEAQELTPSMFSVIHSLLNFESDTQKFLQIVLIGQNELADHIDKIKQIKSRVAMFGQLKPLTFDDAKEMVAFRWQVASAGKSSDPFSDEAIGKIFSFSHGLPRDINKLCHESLSEAMSQEVHTVTAAHVITAAEELRLQEGE